MHTETSAHLNISKQSVISALDLERRKAVSVIFAENENEKMNVYLSYEQAADLYRKLENILYDGSESCQALETRAMAAERRVEELEEAISIMAESRNQGGF